MFLKWSSFGSFAKLPINKKINYSEHTILPNSSVIIDLLDVHTAFYQQSAKEKLQCVCLDSGAQQSIIGTRQAKAYCVPTSSCIQECTRQNAFRFSDVTF